LLFNIVFILDAGLDTAPVKMLQAICNSYKVLNSYLLFNH